MPLAETDRELVIAELGREPTPAEEALFENLWSEHCAYRSSRPLLTAFESDGDRVVVGPGDDAAVVALPGAETDPKSSTESDTYITLGIESHNHPSYVDPFDGAATGVGGIVRDTLSMGAYPIALADCLYFGAFDREHSRYLFEGVVEGISHYGNCIGVPTVAGSVDFHPDYEGNPLVNVACVGLLSADRLVTAEAQRPGNSLVLVGNATGRDGLGGAAFASEDLAEDAETEDRPAVQVGDPYAEKLLIEANEVLLAEDLVESARDLGAAGLGGATSEMVAKGDLGADIELDRVHQREPNMSALEILLAESQERMCYEVRPENVDRVNEIADRFDLGCSVVGEVTDGNYVCTFEDEVVVDVDAEFLGEGAPANDLSHESPTVPERDVPDIDLEDALEAVLSSPNTASKEWVYRQYDHEVGVRTAVGPGDDAAVLAIPETARARTTEGPDRSADEAESMRTDRSSAEANQGAGVGLALSAGSAPNWTSLAPYEGARAVALENATNLAAKGATPLAAVDCLNGGNPEKPDVYGGFKGIVDGLAEMCATLDVPIVGGNVSLYNDSPSGPIPPTPTLAMVGTRDGYDAPPLSVASEGTILVVGDPTLDPTVDSVDVEPALGGSEVLALFDGADVFPDLPDEPPELISKIVAVANHPSTVATHDVSHGGLAVALAEMVGPEAGVSVTLPDDVDPVRTLLSERPGRVVVQTTDSTAVTELVDEDTPVAEIGTGVAEPVLSIATSAGTVEWHCDAIRETRAVIDAEMH